MKFHAYPTAPRALVATLLGLSTASTYAVVLPLGFDNGTGTSSVDQYTGIAGNGWAGAWSSTFHSGTTSGSATVSSSAPLASGGGNYLQLNYNTTNNTSLHVARATRQFDTSAISLTEIFTIEFNFRSLTVASASTQTFNIFGSSSSASGTSGNDSWMLFADANGWSAKNGGNAGTVSLGTGANSVKADETWHFTLTINPVTDTYSVSAQNLTTSSISYSLTNLALRNGADSSLAFLNFNATGAQNVTGLGFAIDSISITSIPEPSTSAIWLGASAVLGATMARRRRTSS